MTSKTLVAGIDSSTQSCKVVIRDADTGELVRSAAARHPDGTEVAPQAWWTALQAAVRDAGGLADVSALAVGGQQHGMVCLDSDGSVVRDALLWNDTRSAPDAADLVAELADGAAGWARAVGSVPLAAFTVSKLRWLARNEPEHATRTAAVCLPHDWLTWQLRGAPGLDHLVTDRGDASGTGYWSPGEDAYRTDLLDLALGVSGAQAHTPQLPRVAAPHERVGEITAAGLAGGVALGPGTGDNAASALGVGAGSADVIVSLGTSGVVCAISETPTADPSAEVAGFADASGKFLPLVCTLNAARVLDAAARMLGIDLDALSALALQAPPGADGLVLVPYLDGERTPNRPDSTGALHGLTRRNSTPAHLARAAVEGMLCGLADGLDALRRENVAVRQVLLVGGAARSGAVRAIAPAVFGVPVLVPEPGEYVADGAARQAAWVLARSARSDAGLPQWAAGATARFEADPDLAVRERYAAVREMTAPRSS